MKKHSENKIIVVCKEELRRWVIVTVRNNSGHDRRERSIRRERCVVIKDL